MFMVVVISLVALLGTAQGPSRVSAVWRRPHSLSCAVYPYRSLSITEPIYVKDLAEIIANACVSNEWPQELNSTAVPIVEVGGSAGRP